MTTLPSLLSPTGIWLQSTDRALVSVAAHGDRWQHDDVRVRLENTPGQSVGILVEAPRTPLRRLALRWSYRMAASALVLGDHWERSYGDLQWRHLQPERVLPWYLLAHDPASKHTVAFGVQTQPAAFCFWTVDPEGVTLWLDLHNGGAPVQLGERTLAAAHLHAHAWTVDTTPFVAAKQFCAQLCPAPRLSRTPICGHNNWYYAYGVDFDANAIRRDAATLAELAGDHPVRPFCVLDAGWTPGSCVPGGPWEHGDPVRFPDLPQLAADLRAQGVRPGIWARLSAQTRVTQPTWLRGGPHPVEEKPLDLSRPEVLAQATEDCARFRRWGYELIKHDFSTYDHFGRWGSQMLDGELAAGDWALHDRSRTNAEVLLNFYRAIRAGAGDAVVIGCNVVGHLAAGLIELQRIGDDTSGRSWERTRRMGVNTLAFRLPQHETLFTIDADCVAHTPAVPWAHTRQFLDLVARSGTPLFLSLDPRVATPEVKREFSRALRLALSGGEPGGVEPLDWLHSTAPARWRLGTETVTYGWAEPVGTVPFPSP